MSWIIVLRVKDYVRNWSNQIIDTGFQNTSARIEIHDLMCKMSIDGNMPEDVFYLLWELLSLYDGYFYEPISAVIDGKQMDVSTLKRLPYYDTDVKWRNSELLGRGQRDLSPTVIAEYAKFRNYGIKDSKMNKSVVNAFYYLHSEKYGRINSNHILSLLLNVADGISVAIYGDLTEVKAKYVRLFRKTVNEDIDRHGVELLGVSSEQYKYNLAEERHMFDHYVYKENSITALMYNAEDEKINFASWYFIYILDLVIRVKILRYVGAVIDQGIVDYATSAIVDWVIYENEIDEKCSTCFYQMRQTERNFQNRTDL